jgi:hypothetical protein
MPSGAAGTVGFDRDREAARVEGVDQRRIELKQRFAAGYDDQTPIALPPELVDPGGQGRGLVSATILAVQTDEVGVAEAAVRGRPVLLSPGPQIAAGEAKKDRAAAGLHALALEGQEDLLDRITHRAGSSSGGKTA